MENDQISNELTHKFKFFKIDENLTHPICKFSQNLQNFAKKTKVLTKSNRIDFLTDVMGVSSGTHLNK